MSYHKLVFENITGSSSDSGSGAVSSQGTVSSAGAGSDVDCVTTFVSKLISNSENTISKPSNQLSDESNYVFVSLRFDNQTGRYCITHLDTFNKYFTGQLKKKKGKSIDYVPLNAFSFDGLSNIPTGFLLGDNILPDFNGCTTITIPKKIYYRNTEIKE